MEADYVIVGGGSAGAVLAGRLSEDPATSVVLLEAGGKGDSLVINTPLAVIAMLPTKLNNWAFETLPQPGLNGRRGYQPRGKSLGGSSAINAMVYIRGHQSDYDAWEAAGNPGWSYAGLLPYFRRSENNERFDDQFHGTGGPLNVADLRTDNPLQQAFVQAAVNAGHKACPDFNGADQEGVGSYQVTQKNGERWSAARGYLLPHLGRPNLTVVTGAQARKITTENGRATGVTFKAGGQIQTVTARREVILSAGAFQSPQLLQLSGIGAGEELRRHGITVIRDLPGVGKNLQDHIDFVFAYDSASLDAIGISLGGSARMMKELSRYRAERRGMFTTNYAEAGGFLKTRPDLMAPDVQLHFVVAKVDDHGRKMHLGHGMSCHVCLLRPKSRGSVSLADPNPDSAPLIDPAFFAESEDLDVMVAGFKLTRRIMESDPIRATWTRDLYSADVRTDDDIRMLLRQRSDTVYHPVGTCRMGQDPLAVVDAELKVHGIAGLRVVDASVMPTLIGGNTNAPTIAIAEKAVDMIRATGHTMGHA